MGQPNIVVFFTDQQRWDSTGVHGNPLGLTPNFDRVAKGGEAVDPEFRKGYGYWLGANALEYTSDSYRTVLYDNDGKPVNLPGYRVDAVADAGIRYIDAHRDEPFFLMMSFIEPHSQNHRDDFPAPLGYEDSYRGRWTPPDLQDLPGGTAGRHLGGYWGMCKRLDETCERVLDALISLGLEENTIVVFTTDHGCHFKTRNAEYKRSCHESSARIPLAITGGAFTGGGEIRKLVSLVDLPPTLLDAAGIPVPAVMQGRSLLPLVRREKVAWPESVFIQISESSTSRALRHGRWS